MSINTAEKIDPLLDGTVHLGKCWAALRGEIVISTFSMRVPNDVDFEAFRVKAISALEMLGDVRTGDLYEKGDEQYFMPRPHKHQNRSKKKPKVEIKPLRLFRPTDDRQTNDSK
jgi:hypothetical protein